MSAERQLRAADRSIRAAVQELAQQQEMVAVWDDLVMELGQNELDLKWIDANIGVWLCKTFGQDEVYILNERDEPISAAIASERVSVRDYDRVRAQIGSLVSGLRQSSDTAHGQHIADPGKSDHLVTGRAVHDAHLLEAPRPACGVSVMKIVPDPTPFRNFAGANPCS